MILYSSPRFIVFQGRWQDLCLGPKSIDGVLTDPPYTAHVHANVRSCSTNGAVKVKEYDVDFDPLTEYAHVPALLQLARRWVLCFCALEQLGAYEAAAGGQRKAGGGFVRSGIWRKQQAAPQLSGDRPANSCEGWALMHPPGGKMTWGGGGKHAYLTSVDSDAHVPAYCEDDPPSFIEAGRERAEKRHAAQKPARLCRRLAQWFVQPGELWLDAYAGSGALGFAAYEQGASVILCDTDPEWAQFCAAHARLLDGNGNAAQA